MLKDALENPEKVLERQLSDKRKLWDRIRSESPDVAEFIMDVSTKFGKPSHVDYWSKKQ